jgi:hypothetical protein
MTNCILLVSVMAVQEVSCPWGTYNQQYGFSCDIAITGKGDPKPNMLNTVEGEVRMDVRAVRWG